MNNKKDSLQPDFDYYIGLVNHLTLDQAFMERMADIELHMRHLTEQQWNFAYAKGKWTVRQMVQHCIDTERIFSARVVMASRKDGLNFKLFDHNSYAKIATASLIDSEELLNAYLHVLRSTLYQFRGLTPEMIEEKAVLNSKEYSVKQLGQIMAGHIFHHNKILKERYLNI